MMPATKKKIYIGVGIFLILGILGAGLFRAQFNQKHKDHKESVAEKKQTYFCPMHPNYTSDKPGDCPICGMKLVPMEEEKLTEQMHSEHEEHKKEETEARTVPGQATISISLEREQLIGVKTEVVSYRDLKRMVRASAEVAYDPDLYSAITEYQAALEVKNKSKESEWPQVEERSNSLVRAAELRLRQLGLSFEQIKNIHPEDASPTDLILSEKGKSVWVYIQVYEFESGLVQSGQTVKFTSAALKGKEFLGTVIAVDPIIAQESRSLKVRARVENREGWLKPHMYLDAQISVDLGKKLAIREESVLNTGERQIAFVQKEKGKYEPRELTLGEEGEGYVEVLKGVREGERAVSSANFLIDSESKLKSALSSPAHQH